MKSLRETVNTENKAHIKESGLVDPVSDELLWQSFKNGSESAFIDIYNAYFQLLYNFGRQYTNDTELVKDCIQEVFIKTRIKRTKLPKVYSIKAYLIQATRNQILTEIRDSRKNRQVKISPSTLNFLVTPCIETVLITRQFNQDQIEVMMQAVAQLSVRQREAIYHFYYADLGYEEIKIIMGFSSARAARNLVYRALAEIRKSFTNQEKRNSLKKIHFS